MKKGAAETAAERPKIPDIGVHRRCPELTVVPRRDGKSVRLGQWRELAESAEAAPLPSLLGPVVARQVGPLSLSVSRIEEVEVRSRDEQPLRRTKRRATKDADEGAEPFGEAATLIGTLVHRVIERLPHDAAIDAETIADGVQLVLKGQSSRDLEACDPAALVRRVQALVESPLWDEMRSARRCFREIEFLLGWPIGAAPAERTAVISGTLDCLLQTPDGQWKILDYRDGPPAR